MLLEFFSVVSKMLRQTPLRRLKWLGYIHNRIYGGLSARHIFDLGEFVIELDPRDRTIAKNLELYGQYEEFIASTLQSAAIAGTTVIDIGANVGLHAVPLAQKVGEQGQVIAFEPDPDNYRLLRSNVERNGLANVQTHNVGLSFEQGKALLYQSAANRGSLSMREENVQDWGQHALEPVEIRLEVADDMLKDVSGPVSLIKIDVEGAEPLVIRGMKQTLRRNPNVKLIFEFWPRMIRQFEIKPLDFLRELEQEGFSLKLVDEDRRDIIPMEADKIVDMGSQSDAALNLIAAR